MKYLSLSLSCIFNVILVFCILYFVDVTGELKTFAVKRTRTNDVLHVHVTLQVLSTFCKILEKDSHTLLYLKVLQDFYLNLLDLRWGNVVFSDFAALSYHFFTTPLLIYFQMNRKDLNLIC